MTKPLFLIVNPRSAKRATGRKWPQLESALRRVLPPFDAALTTRRGDAEALAADARGYETVVAIGGDGTINEVANGILSTDSGVAMGILPRGTGSDLVRSLHIPHKLMEAADLLAQGKRRTIEAGRARFATRSGSELERWFVNAAEVGIGAMVVQAVNRPSRLLPGPAAFMWALATTQFRHHPTRIAVTTDGGEPRTLLLSNAWVANGRYTGSGILSAPRAELDDGLLDVVTVEHANPLVRLLGLPKLRSGRFTELRQTAYRQATVARFEAVEGAGQLVELDGDLVGMTPASFKVTPGRLNVIAG